MANIVPLSGLGSRFSEAGFDTPKPLIEVSGIPMIIKAIRSMPSSDKWIFVVRREHVEEYRIDEVILKEIPDAIIISINETTLGQANTCLLAQGHVLPDEPLFIAACDNGYVYDKEKYNELIDREDIDSIVWTFTKMKKMKKNPNAYGWLVLEPDNMTIKDVSVKKPVSDNPYFDHAITATFYFKRAGDFFEAANLMMKENYKTKGEFYVDSIPIFLKKLGKKSVIFDVDQWIGWGTPKELEEYEYWETFFKEKKLFNPQKDNKEAFEFWKKYFDQ